MWKNILPAQIIRMWSATPQRCVTALSRSIVSFSCESFLHSEFVSCLYQWLEWSSLKNVFAQGRQRILHIFARHVTPRHPRVCKHLTCSNGAILIKAVSALWVLSDSNSGMFSEEEIGSFGFLWICTTSCAIRSIGCESQVHVRVEYSAKFYRNVRGLGTHQSFWLEWISQKKVSEQLVSCSP